MNMNNENAAMEFQMLIAPYNQRLYRALYLIVRNEQDAADLYQDTLVRAFQNIHRYDRQQPLYPWLLTIGRNLSRNHFRRKETQTGQIPDEIEIPSHYRNPEEALIRTEESREIMNVLNKLKPEQREILELKHFQDCSYQEISEILDIPIGTVMSRLYYARKELAQNLEKGR